MKQQLIYRILTCLLLVSLFFSCRKTDYEYIGNTPPDERENEYMSDFKQTLLSATQGWVGYLHIPQNDRGYTFYMDFKEHNRVVMYSDFTDSTMKNSKESSFSLRNTGIPSLIFDTYNYIHLPADPNGDISGGKTGEGLGSDFEFSILRFSDDSVILKGNLKNCEMVMVKNTIEDKAKLTTGALAENIAKLKEYFITNKNNYITLIVNGSERKVGINLANDTKQLNYQVVEPNDGFSSLSKTFFYSVNGIEIADSFAYAGVVFKSMRFNSDDNLLLIDATGKEYELLQSPVILTPLKASFKYDGTYKSIRISGQSLPTGVASGWNEIYNAMVVRFNNASGRTINYMEFLLVNAIKARVKIEYSSSSGSVYLADAEFDYIIEDDELKLSNYVPSISNANWDTRKSQIGEVADYFVEGGPFKIDWVAGSGDAVLGGLYPVNNPSTFFYGVLQK